MHSALISAYIDVNNTQMHFNFEYIELKRIYQHKSEDKPLNKAQTSLKMVI